MIISDQSLLVGGYIGDSMWGKKDMTDIPDTSPSAVPSGNPHGNDIVVGDHNSPNRKVVIKQSYFGTPDSEFKYIVDDSMVSAVQVEGKGYLADYVVGNVRPSDYWDKKTFHTVKTEVSILSFSEIVFSIASPITFRASGGDVDATVFGDFRFTRGNPRNISSLLDGSFAKTETEGRVERVFITAEGLEQIIRTGIQDIVRKPLFRDRVYSDCEKVSDAILGLIRESPFFSERCLEATQLDVRPDRTEYEKLDDAEVMHSITMRRMELNAEEIEKKKQLSHETLVADQERAIRLEEIRKRLTEIQLEIEDEKRAGSIKDAEAELQRIKLSLDAEHYETDYQDGRKQRDLDEQQRREIEAQRSTTDNLIRMAQAAMDMRGVPGSDPRSQKASSERDSNSVPNPSHHLYNDSEPPTIAYSKKDIPSDIATIFETMKAVVDGSGNDLQSDGSAIIMSPVVRNLPHNFKGTVAATDSITFEPSKVHLLNLHYLGERIVSAYFYEEIAFRREIDPEGQKLAVYSDYANYLIGNDRISPVKVRTMTRQPVLLINVGDRFYVWCMKETGYLKIDNSAVNQGEITELELGKKVSLGTHMWFEIETA